MNIKQTIKEARKEKGLTQSELAKMVGVGDTYISKIEAGTVPSPELLFELAGILDLNIDFLLSRSGQWNNDELKRINNAHPALGAFLICVQQNRLTQQDWATIQKIVDVAYFGDEVPF
jgi:transcriptional regulator with XRE-family HTH domain